MSFKSLKKIIIKLMVVMLFLLPVTHVHAAVLEVVKGSFSSSNGDAAHNFTTLEGKLDALLPKLYQQGHNPKITSITVSIQKQGVRFFTTYSATVEDSSDGKAWMGFTARGSFGNTPSVNCPLDNLRQNYQIRADGQISGCENSDGRSLEDKLKSGLSAGEVQTIFMYDNPSVLVREYFVQFTKPATYPPIVAGQTSPTQTPSNKVPVVNAGVDQTTTPLQQVFLEGSATDADGTIVSYQWTKDSGSGTIFAPTSNKTTIKDLTEGTSVFRLTAKDNKGGVGSDTVAVVTTKTSAPTATNNSGYLNITPTAITTSSATFSVKYSGSAQTTISAELSGGVNYFKSQNYDVSPTKQSFQATFSGLDSGSTYAFLVMPIDGALSNDSNYVNKFNFSTPTTDVAAGAAFSPTTNATGASAGNQCTNGKDDQIGDGKDYGLGVGKGDGKADNGVDTEPKDGIIDLEPDPSCFSSNATVEAPDDLAYNSDGTLGSIIPCTDKCTFGDLFKLLNNLFTFFFKILLIPIFVLMIMYAGFSYLQAQFNGGKKVALKSMFGHMFMGLLLILCAWLIVRTILVVLGYQEGLVFFQD